MDEFIDQLLTEERVCDIILPRLTKRQVLEENGDIGPRKSLLLDVLEGRSDRESEGGSNTSWDAGSQYLSRSPSRSVSSSPLHSREHTRSPPAESLNHMDMEPAG